MLDPSAAPVDGALRSRLCLSFLRAILDRRRFVMSLPGVSASETRRKWRANAASVAHLELLEECTLLAAPHPVDLGSLDGTTGSQLDRSDASDWLRVFSVECG